MLIAILQQPSPCTQPDATRYVTCYRAGAKNGIRLVDGAGPRGRLEVSSTDGWVSGLYDGSVAWRPLCDSGVFDDYTAQVRAPGTGPHWATCCKAVLFGRGGMGGESRGREVRC